MNYIALALKLLPILVQIAEKVFATPKSGMLKKEFVLDIAGYIASGMDQTLTGGASETWNRIKPDVSNAIDAAANIAFPRTGQEYTGPQ